MQAGRLLLQTKKRTWLQALLSNSVVWNIEGSKEIGGLGSSHTAPCGAAVPARPPTRSSETTHLDCTPQWVPRATRRGTTVVVQSAPFSPFSGDQYLSKAFNYYKLRTRRPPNPSPATMNSTTLVPPNFSALRAPRFYRQLFARWDRCSQVFVHQTIINFV
jgi:hypothetical protein